MLKTHTSAPSNPPRIGIPWRTEKQERARDLRYNQDYLDSVRRAGGEAIPISLLSPPDKLAQIAKTFDAFVLPGSPADIDPRLYGAQAHAKSAPPDRKRQHTDFALLEHALATGKPVLAICYGIQSLNVYLGGSLCQDIPSQRRGALVHSSRMDPRDAAHEIRVTGGRLAALAHRSVVRVNSTHHQSIQRPGKGLRVTAKAPDGVIEAVEWIGGPAWGIGVQWHPERMPKDPLAQNLFRRLVMEAIIARNAMKPASVTRPTRRHKPAGKAKGRATRAAGKAIHKRGSKKSSFKRKPNRRK